ncbi:hypothetical protein AK830_g3501 [Neonectria ditissima]|uniref:Uncharacterized protein n=1 Tax=Neonectria ditissima TaxID=78410 RepID=A0A0P7BBN1_9HYPO|nr:hypothetical protein AK830_g3501 [Neonectria ditissima]
MSTSTVLDYFPALTSLLGLGFAVAGFVVFAIVFDCFVAGVPYPKGVALVREPEGARRFSFRTRLAYYTDCKALYRDAYNNYGKKGLPVVIPGLGFQHSLIMPPSSMGWVIAQPDAVLSTAEAFADIDQFEWSLGSRDIVLDAWPGFVVKRDMNRVLEATCAAMNNELQFAFDQRFGTDTKNWREIDLLPTIQLIVAQLSGRFTVGLPLCRNEDYLRTVLDLNQELVLVAGVSGMTPRLLRPIVGTLVSLKSTLGRRRMGKWMIPLWKKRLETLQFDREAADHDEPLDLTQMMVRYAHKERPDQLADYGGINDRMASLNFGTVHQTGMQVTNLLLNVVASDPEFDTVAVLRAEAEAVLGTDGSDLWTKAKVNQMLRADSVGRETLRLHSFGGRSTFRKVMTGDFETPDGLRIPRGTPMSFLSQPVHTDGSIAEDPEKFVPFRFSSLRERAAADGGDKAAQPLGLVSTSPEFLPFGHGRHACPGRFLIDFELKMIMAHVLRNYDLKFPEEYNGQRPPNEWLAEAVFPPKGAKLMVKRREKGSNK